MTPDVDTRLTTVALALREIVLPAIPSSEVLAREQVDVVLGHLAVFAEQYRHVTDYEAMCLTDMARSARPSSRLQGKRRGGPCRPEVARGT